MATSEIDLLIQLISKLPGLGPRSARRATLHLIKNKEQLLKPLVAAMASASESVQQCNICGNLDTVNPCTIAQTSGGTRASYALWRTWPIYGRLKGQLLSEGGITLGGVLSPLDGIGPEDLSIGALVTRADQEAISEVILAISATVDGKTTAHYITDRLADCSVSVTALAHGIPVGGELDYLDDGTLSAALKERRQS